MLEEWIRKVGEGDKSLRGSSLWGKWGNYILVILLGLGVLALIWPGGGSQSGQRVAAENQSSTQVFNAKTSLGQELQSILSQVEGAGRVEVSLTLSSDGAKSYASNTRNESRETQEVDGNRGERKIIEENLVSDIAVSGGTPLLVEDMAPQVVGVLVVADGAADAVVKEKLARATTTLLNIPSYRVCVVARKGDFDDSQP